MVLKNINFESRSFVDNEKFIRGFEIDPMFYMRKRLNELFKSKLQTCNLQCNFLEAFENLILIQKVSRNIMSKGDYYRMCWSLVDTCFEVLNDPILFQRFTKVFSNGWTDVILKPEKWTKLFFLKIL
jgi:hypothetical protein